MEVFKLATWINVNQPNTIEIVIYFMIVFGVTKSGWFNKGWKFSLHLLLLPFMLYFLKVGHLSTTTILLCIIPSFYILLVLPYKEVNKRMELNQKLD